MKPKNKSGFSLVEVMVAALILVVLVIGGAALLAHAGSNVQVVGNKRVALERARTRMEQLRATDYMVLRERAVAAGNREITTTSETYNGVLLSISSTNQLVSSGGVLGNEYLALSVRASYRGANESVLLHARKTISP